MEYIIDAKPEIRDIDKEKFFKVKEKIEEDKNVTKEEMSLFLDYYVKESREVLSKYLNVNILEDPLINRCDLAQYITGKLLESVKNVSVFPKESQNVFSNTCMGHSFLVCMIQDIPYLIDLTYRQFFVKERCLESEFIYFNNMTLKTPCPGYFAIQDKEGEKVAREIISKGYIELNDNVAKKYGDSFYFTKTGYRENFNMPGEVYLNGLIAQNSKYAVNDERFLEMYGKVI